MVSPQEIGLFAVFLEGILSFLSPCVLPLIPLYMAYLSKGAKSIDETGEVHYATRKVFLTTVFFILGISFTFVILGLSLSWLKNYIEDYKNIIGIIGGTILILFGLGQMGILEFSFSKTLRLPFLPKGDRMNLMEAFLLGFAFSFAWTPCIGPMLTNVLLMASSQDVLMGNLYLLFYVLGLVLPFLILGLFTKAGLDFLKKHQKAFVHTLKIAGVIILCFGAYMIYDNSQAILSLKNAPAQNETVKNDVLSLSDVTLYDQEGISHAIKEHEGEYVILNFIATWCKYCKQEIPVFEEFVKKNELVAYFVMSPEVNGGDEEEIRNFHKEHGMNLPTLIDPSGSFFQSMGISSFPTMVVIGPDGSYVGYVSGMLEEEQLNEVLMTAKQMYESR